MHFVSHQAVQGPHCEFEGGEQGDIWIVTPEAVKTQNRAFLGFRGFSLNGVSGLGRSWTPPTCLRKDPGIAQAVHPTLRLRPLLLAQELRHFVIRWGNGGEVLRLTTKKQREEETRQRKHDAEVGLEVPGPAGCRMVQEARSRRKDMR